MNLSTLLPAKVIQQVDSYVHMRLCNQDKFKTPWAIALYEQNLLPENQIHKLCEEEYGRKLYVPATTAIPNDVARYFRETNVVPVAVNTFDKMISLAALPELGETFEPYPGYNCVVYYTPIYYYLGQYTHLYGKSPDLVRVPARNLFDMIIEEAIGKEAADITMSSSSENAICYYSVRKRKVFSRVIITPQDVKDIKEGILTITNPQTAFSKDPVYNGMDLTDKYRGRIVCNDTYKGIAITIRLLPNAFFDRTLESCNIHPETIEFFRSSMMNNGNGLRIIAGSTASGKNTTILACLNELVHKEPLKVVSVEMPVEQELPGIEQINCTTTDEYTSNINSLIRQNPDFIYITEINNDTATDVLQVANTGKRVISTLHANSCADIIPRLMDLTGLPIERIIQPMHTLVYQELIPDPRADRLLPMNKYIYLSKERKQELYGKSFGEIMSLLSSWEGGDIW